MVFMELVKGLETQREEDKLWERGYPFAGFEAVPLGNSPLLQV